MGGVHPDLSLPLSLNLLCLRYTSARTFSPGSSVNTSGRKESEMSGNVCDVTSRLLMACVGGDVRCRGARRCLVNGTVSNK